jgi:hypothetical protein
VRGDSSKNSTKAPPHHGVHQCQSPTAAPTAAPTSARPGPCSPGSLCALRARGRGAARDAGPGAGRASGRRSQAGAPRAEPAAIRRAAAAAGPGIRVRCVEHRWLRVGVGRSCGGRARRRGYDGRRGASSPRVSKVVWLITPSCPRRSRRRRRNLRQAQKNSWRASGSYSAASQIERFAR